MEEGFILNPATEANEAWNHKEVSEEVTLV